MAKKVVKKKSELPEIDSSFRAYLFGILSVVLALVSPIVGLVLGIVGLVNANKKEDPLSAKGKKLSIIGIVIAGILMLAQIVLTFVNLSSLGQGLI